MKTLRPTLETLIRNSVEWRITVDGVFQAVYELYLIYTVQEEELVERHPLLPRMLRLAAKPSEDSSGYAKIRRPVVSDTLDFLENKLLPMHVCEYGFLLFGSIIELRTESDFRIGFYGRAVIIDNMVQVGPDVGHVIGPCTDFFMVEHDVLTQYYPGWEQRWITGKQLGLKEHALSDYIFKPQASRPLELQDLSFDNV